MKYNWDLKKINTLKQKHIELLRKTNGLTKEEKKGIKEQIEKLKQMENTLNPTFSLPNLKNTKYVDKEKMLSQNALQNYLEIPPKIRQTILKALPIIKNFSENNINLPKRNITNQELIELSHDFYQWLPKSFLQLFLAFTNPNNHLIQFTNLNTADTLLGETYFFYYPYYTPFFKVAREKTIKDFLTLNHEIAHGIFYAFENNLSINTNHYYALELEGSYFDFLSLEFLKENNMISMQEKKALEYFHISTIVESFELFYLNYLKVLCYKNSKQITLEAIFQKSLEQGLSDFINPTDIYLDIDAKSEAKYIISFLIQLDLAKKYNENPSTAFQNFLNVRENKKEELLQVLLDNQITFTQDGYQNLQRKIKNFH